MFNTLLYRRLSPFLSSSSFSLKERKQRQSPDLFRMSRMRETVELRTARGRRGSVGRMNSSIVELPNREVLKILPSLESNMQSQRGWILFIGYSRRYLRKRLYVKKFRLWGPTHRISEETPLSPSANMYNLFSSVYNRAYKVDLCFKLHGNTYTITSCLYFES